MPHERLEVSKSWGVMTRLIESVFATWLIRCNFAMVLLGYLWAFIECPILERRLSLLLILLYISISLPFTAGLLLPTLRLAKKYQKIGLFFFIPAMLLSPIMVGALQTSLLYLILVPSLILSIIRLWKSYGNSFLVFKRRST